MTAIPHRSRRAGTALAGLLVAGLLTAAATDPLVPARAEAAPRAAAPMPAAASGFTWSPARVRELIAAVEASRRDGLDPDDYGLAALRSELELAEQLWGTPGSRQLDALARASALALAADYRRPRRADPSSLRLALDAALAAGTLRGWAEGNRAGLRTVKGTL